MSFIFLKPLPKVTNGRVRKLADAAIMASGVFTLLRCLISIAMFLIPGVRSMIIQSCKSSESFCFSILPRLGHPKSSISEMMEIIVVPSRKGSVFDRPSCTLIRKLVSATKLNPFVSDLLLIRNSVQSSFKFTVMFTQRFFLPFFGYSQKGLFNFLFCNRSFDFDNHINEYKENTSVSLLNNIMLFKRIIPCRRRIRTKRLSNYQFTIIN